MTETCENLPSTRLKPYHTLRQRFFAPIIIALVLENKAKAYIKTRYKQMVKREHWGSQLGFIMAAAGSAIGLGTMWKLPYMMGQNGGGAFILLFLFFSILVGLPLFIGELLLGRQSQKGAVAVFDKFAPESSWNIVGWLSVISSFLILGWYCVIAGWGFNYILLALVDAFQSMNSDQVGIVFDVFRDSGDLNILWQIVFLASNALILTKGLSKGIEKFSKIMTSGLFIALIILVAYAATLSGFTSAAKYVLYPDFSALNSNSILAALSMALFTLSLGYGIMVTYGSYMTAKDDIPKTSFIVAMANFIISVLIALMIFPLAFTFGFGPGEGEGLIFKIMPYVFEQLPGSLILTMLFFSLLLCAALTSSVSMFEVTVANFIDLKGWSRKKAVWVSIVICFFLGLPVAFSNSDIIFGNWQKIFGTDFFNTINALTDWTLSIVALFTSLFIGFKLPKEITKKGFCDGSASARFYGLWRFSLRLLVPLSIVLVILSRAGLLNLL